MLYLHAEQTNTMMVLEVDAYIICLVFKHEMVLAMGMILMFIGTVVDDEIVSLGGYTELEYTVVMVRILATTMFEQKILFSANTSYVNKISFSDYYTLHDSRFMYLSMI